MARHSSDIFSVRFDQALAVDGRTNEQFARDVGVGLRQVMRWRSGDSAPTGASLVALAAELRRDPAWFYEPSGDDTPTTRAAA